jgi:flagellar basal body-associated protein FliL
MKKLICLILAVLCVLSLTACGQTKKPADSAEGTKPTTAPTTQPTTAPTTAPTTQPTTALTTASTAQSGTVPTTAPTAQPTTVPNESTAPAGPSEPSETQRGSSWILPVVIAAVLALGLGAFFALKSAKKVK